jgi:multiple sugar transport system substrate-binding protein
MKFQIIGPDDPALAVLDKQLKNNPQWQTELKIIRWADYQSTMMTALQSPRSPYQAVCVPGHIWLPGLAAGNLLAAMDDLIPSVSRDSIDAYQSEDIVLSVAQECRFEDRQYILPLFTDGHIVFYRKDILSLPPIFDPLQLPQILSNLTLADGMFPLALKAHPSEILLDWLPYLWAHGGKVVDADGNPTFDSKEAVEALKFYISLKQFCAPDVHTYGNGEVALALKEGRTALAASWGGQAAFILDEGNLYRDLYDFSVFTTPWNATWGVSIPANLTREEQAGMLAVLYAAASPQQDRQVTRVAGSPVRTSSYTPEELAEFPWLQAQQEMLNRCQTLPATVDFNMYLGTLYAAVYEAFTGQLSPEDALKKAARTG